MDGGDLEQVMALIEADEALAQRVAALEAIIAHPLMTISAPPHDFTDEQVAELREAFGTAMSGPYQHRILPSAPPLTPDQVRQLLRECVTVVKPGETLVIRDRNWTPNQVREIQDWMDAIHGAGIIGFKVLAVIGDELGVAEPGGVPGAP